MEKKEIFKRQEMIDYLPEFLDLYEKRIINNNDGGMKSNHLLPTCFIINKLKPKHIVESGVWKGLGTWFFEKVSPNSEIISIDPSPSFRVYTSDKVQYKTQDFTQIDWSTIDKDNTILFFDDHQNSLERIKHAKKLGFKKLIFEDNYPHLQGDCYSPKKILSQKDWVIDSMGVKNWFPYSEDDYNYFIENVKYYQEMPPIFKTETTRWGDKWELPNYDTVNPLLNEDDADKYPLFYDEAKSYTWLCYIELK